MLDSWRQGRKPASGQEDDACAAQDMLNTTPGRQPPVQLPDSPSMAALHTRSFQQLVITWRSVFGVQKDAVLATALHALQRHLPKYNAATTCTMRPLLPVPLRLTRSRAATLLTLNARFSTILCCSLITMTASSRFFPRSAFLPTQMMWYSMQDKAPA